MTFKVYLFQRLIATLVTLYILLTIAFIVIRIIPGDPAIALLPTDVPPEVLEAMRVRLGLDKPLHLQYIDFMRSVMTLNLGRSWIYERDVLGTVLFALPTTIELAISGMIVGLALGLGLGILSSYTQDRLPDHIIRVINMLVYAVPIFLLGVAAQSVFGVGLGWLPVEGRIGIAPPPRITGFNLVDSILNGNMPALASSLKHLVLPALALGIHLSVVFSRITRTEVINVLKEDYIRTAEAKGVPRLSIFYRHALRNALLPVTTVIGLQFATLLGGSVITEAVFNLPGVGSLLIFALTARDYPLMQGCLIVSALWVAIATFTIDLLYGVIDPRIREK